MTIEQRMENLERTVRRQRAVLMAITILAMGVATLGATSGGVADVIRTRELYVVGADGAPRVAIGATTDGSGIVETYNSQGAKLVALGTTAGGDGLVETFNSKGQDAIVTTTPGDGAAETLKSNGEAIATTADGDGAATTLGSKGQDAIVTTTPGDGAAESDSGVGSRGPVGHGRPPPR